MQEQVPTGVGRTAIMVSWIRSAEGRRPDGLFRDPFADEVLAELANSSETADLMVALNEGTPLAKRLSSAQFSFIPVRTRYFDDHLLAAMRGGIRQVVNLAAGLDGRPMRLACPPDTQWYELDLPAMTDFKKALLRRTRLASACERHVITADLTTEWSTKLIDAGFDPAVPTAWLIEGLLMYMSDDMDDRLLATVTKLSAPGSELLLEHLSRNSLASSDTPLRREVESQGARWISARDDLAHWLAGFGWYAEVHANNDATISYGRSSPETTDTWLWLAHAVLS